MLCFDHFYEVYESFGKGTTKGQKIELLLDYCARYDRLGELMGYVEQLNATQYVRYGGAAEAVNVTSRDDPMTDTRDPNASHPD